ncbi:hypothetical protein [uncultured Methylobacterium sp.]|uniref:hypothetical protein n=1 Tax=uncultured Methylobacterium sp. TaxID=157278 RepID=UPI0035CB51C0
MTLSPRQARLRLARSIEDAGGQKAWRLRNGLVENYWQTAVSKGLHAKVPLRAEILAAIGLRVNPNTDEIEDVAVPRSSFRFVAVQASGEAGVAAALAMISAAFSD